MKWQVHYGTSIDEDWQPSPITVRDVYLWAKKKGYIKKFPRKLKKGCYYSEPYSTKYHSKIFEFVKKYYYMYLED